ncbi:MAG TPA: lipoprotein insertase outer membrane protein LolB [Methylophilaceae bacterium]|nr:lipoprotein insertase outer membrane protein LolB [Methylophilaceae bacterium]
MSASFRAPVLRRLPLLAALTMAGCAALPSQQQQPASTPQIHQQHLASLANIKQFYLEGRIGVQAEGRGFSGTTRWHHEGPANDIGLFSPLGSQVAKINITADGVTLITNNGKIYRANNAETLTQETLGWSLPMQGLPDWVLGRPKAGPVTESHWDQAGRLTRLQQDGWNIEYPQYAEAEGYQLPTKVTLRSPKLNLKLVIEQWYGLPDKDNRAQEESQQ